MPSLSRTRSCPAFQDDDVLSRGPLLVFRLFALHRKPARVPYHLPLMHLSDWNIAFQALTVPHHLSTTLIGKQPFIDIRSTTSCHTDANMQTILQGRTLQTSPRTRHWSASGWAGVSRILPHACCHKRNSLLSLSLPLCLSACVSFSLSLSLYISLSPGTSRD